MESKLKQINIIVEEYRQALQEAVKLDEEEKDIKLKQQANRKRLQMAGESLQGLRGNL